MFRRILPKRHPHQRHALWARESLTRQNSASWPSGNAARPETENGSDWKLAKDKPRAAVVVYSYYESDPRPRREAEALLRAGMEVEVLSLRSDATKPRFESIAGVNVRRLSLKRRRHSKVVYFFQYLWFLLASAWILSVRSLTRRYQVVHVHNMPDILVFSALIPRLRGAKVVLDLHDPMPELSCGIYGISAEHFLVRCLQRMEKMSVHFADLVLTPNLAFKEKFLSRGCPAGKVQVVMNSPEARIFSPAVPPAPVGASSLGNRPFVLMYHGLLVHRHGLDVAIRAIARTRRCIPRIEMHFYGTSTPFVDAVDQLIGELGLRGVVKYHGWKSLKEIAQSIAAIDLGLIPNRRNDFTQINLPTRIFEYLAMNKPVVVPRTSGIQDYFREDEIIYFEPGSVEDLANKLQWVYLHPQETEDIMERGRKVYERHCWELEERHFIRLVRDLTKPSIEQPKTKAPEMLCLGGPGGA